MQGVKVDLTGQRFGKLVILGPAPNRQRGYQLWYVQCDCGSPIKTVITSNLLKKIRGTRSCGCLTRCKKGQAARNRVLKWYKANAIRRGVSWELSEVEFDSLTSQDCHYCNQPPSGIAKPSDSSNGSFVYNGIDRVDNSSGYKTHNVVPCCKDCNWAKGKMSYEQFLAYIQRLVRNYSRKQTTDILVRSQSA